MKYEILKDTEKKRHYLQRSNNQTESRSLVSNNGYQRYFSKDITLQLGLYTQEQYYSIVSKKIHSQTCRDWSFLLNNSCPIDYQRMHFGQNEIEFWMKEVGWAGKSNGDQREWWLCWQIWRRIYQNKRQSCSNGVVNNLEVSPKKRRQQVFSVKASYDIDNVPIRKEKNGEKKENQTEKCAKIMIVLACINMLKRQGK